MTFSSSTYQSEAFETFSSDIKNRQSEFNPNQICSLFAISEKNIPMHSDAPTHSPLQSFDDIYNRIFISRFTFIRYIFKRSVLLLPTEEKITNDGRTSDEVSILIKIICTTSTSIGSFHPKYRCSIMSNLQPNGAKNFNEQRSRNDQCSIINGSSIGYG